MGEFVSKIVQLRLTLFKKNILKEAKYKYVIKTAPIGEIYHSSPIQLLMMELKMPVYYG